MNEKILYKIALSILFINCVHATSYVSPELNELGGVSAAVTLYRQSNHGRLPKSWDELATILDLEKVNKNLPDGMQLPIQDRYQIVDSPMELPLGERGSNVFMIRTEPIEVSRDNKSKHIRYIICISPDGAIMPTSLSEDKVQVMLSSAGITIKPMPTPKTVNGNMEEDARSFVSPMTTTLDSVNAKSTKTKSTKQISFTLVIGGAVLLVVLVTVIAIRRRTR